MKELIGKTVVSLEVNEYENMLVFNCADDKVVYYAYGECCSETWFADIVGVQCLIGATVVDSQDISLPAVEDDRCRQEYDKFYGVKLTTNKGYVDIVYRNSSNGYYGGEFDLYTNGDLSRYTFREITDDWSA
jgi:hypothetical protein